MIHAARPKASGGFKGELILVDLEKQGREKVCIGHSDSSVEEVSVAGEILKKGRLESKCLQCQWGRALRKTIDQKHFEKWRCDYCTLDFRNEQLPIAWHVQAIQMALNNQRSVFWI